MLPALFLVPQFYLPGLVEFPGKMISTARRYFDILLRVFL